MPGVSSAQVASALVNIRGLSSASSRVPSTSTPNISRYNNVLVLCSLGVVSGGIFEERHVLLELPALSVGAELRLLAVMVGWDAGGRGIVDAADAGAWPCW